MSNENNPFNIVNKELDSEKIQQSSNEIESGFDEADVTKRIQKIIGSAKIVVFMKGNSFFPQCGFSMNTVKMIQHFGLEYKTYDILQDPELRTAIKEYSNWPTFPQVFKDGKLLGGNDILTEMFQSGSLEQALK
jgi:monothiol glutaredoxin